MKPSRLAYFGTTSTSYASGGGRKATTDIAPEDRAQLQTVLQNMDEAVLAFNAAGRLTLFNDSAKAIFELGPEAFGQHITDVLPLPALIDAWRQPNDTPESIETGWPGPPPRRLLARLTTENSSGGTVLVIHDITALRHLETVRRDFIANVSHELRTPISIVCAAVENLQDGGLEDPETTQRFVASIGRQAERLSRLVNDLLDLSRIESGHINTQKQPLLLQTLVERIFHTLADRITHRNVRATCDVGTLRVIGDAQALEQVLFNLVDNAINHGPDAGIIQVWAEALGSRVRLHVCDQGPGVLPEHHARVFERFFRADSSRKLQGTGLGLAIVKHLVNAMGGRVGVHQATLGGADFWIELPRSTA